MMTFLKELTFTMGLFVAFFCYATDPVTADLKKLDFVIKAEKDQKPDDLGLKPSIFYSPSQDLKSPGLTSYIVIINTSDVAVRLVNFFDYSTLTCSLMGDSSIALPKNIRAFVDAPKGASLGDRPYDVEFVSSKQINQAGSISSFKIKDLEIIEIPPSSESTWKIVFSKLEKRNGDKTEIVKPVKGLYKIEYRLCFIADPSVAKKKYASFRPLDFEIDLR